ncbi:hypothetical protein EJB05_25126 [Eragrostis curvula]|uniref:Uncharacterized protein n=1 Tax=Eragrostis curvula TaxID=38414 RepID=A0A5J9VBI4_9POAL|nr:hypothetical protein EJB05_25126 [Eragrostis curvula]
MVRVDPSLAINLEHHQQGGAHGFSSLDGKERLPAITTYKSVSVWVFSECANSTSQPEECCSDQSFL